MKEVLGRRNGVRQCVQALLDRCGRQALLFAVVALLLPLVDLLLPAAQALTGDLAKILIYAVLALGLQLIVGCTGLLHLGAAGFMAIGAYAYAIATCAIYPFQIGFAGGALVALAAGAGAGALLCLPLLRLRGDYLAITTLAFGEIVQDALRNLDVITKGAQGLNPLPPPAGVFTVQPGGAFCWYYLLLAVAGLLAALVARLLAAAPGRAWLAVREDELAARAAGLASDRVKLSACVLGSAICALSGALYASWLTTSSEPATYDFNVSVLALCIIIVGGLGTVRGALLGAAVVVGFIDIVLVRLAAWAGQLGADSQLLQPSSWKYLVLGLALVLVSRYRAQGLCPEAPGTPQSRRIARG